MKLVIIGLGIQGRKRMTVAGDDVVATVDPVSKEQVIRTWSRCL